MARKAKRPKTARQFVRKNVTNSDMMQGFSVVPMKRDLRFADNPVHADEEPKARK